MPILAYVAWALPHSIPWKVKQKGHVCSFEKVNGFKYPENWLQHFLLSGSLGGLDVSFQIRYNMQKKFTLLGGAYERV